MVQVQGSQNILYNSGHMVKINEGHNLHTRGEEKNWALIWHVLPLRRRSRLFCVNHDEAIIAHARQIITKFLHETLYFVQDCL